MQLYIYICTHVCVVICACVLSFVYIIIYTYVYIYIIRISNFKKDGQWKHAHDLATAQPAETCRDPQKLDTERHHVVFAPILPSGKQT